MLTRQQIFDKVVERLEDGTGQASENGVTMLGLTSCTYLNEDGLKCAVGIFLPDNKDMQSCDGSIFKLIKNFENHPDFPPELVEHSQLLYELQRIHDSCGNWNDKKFIGQNRLKEIANFFGLKYSG